MAATGLHGPGVLTEIGIDEIVKGVGPGAYVLGRNTPGTFYVDYVGRSDGDLNGRLKDWAGSKYTHFKYGFYDTAEAAFLKECHLYHDWGGGTANLDNKVHPARPTNSKANCPIADCDALE
jgi:hypothetical protein